MTDTETYDQLRWKAPLIKRGLQAAEQRSAEEKKKIKAKQDIRQLREFFTPHLSRHKYFVSITDSSFPPTTATNSHAITQVYCKSVNDHCCESVAR